jgi:hypothetical protein
MLGAMPVMATVVGGEADVAGGAAAGCEDGAVGELPPQAAVANRNNSHALVRTR